MLITFQKQQVDDPNRNLLDEYCAGDSILKLNIGGTVFRLKIASIFARNDDSRLVHFATFDLEKRQAKCDAYIQSTDEYYFERSAVLFDSIFKYYATGQLHRPLDVCPSEFSQELGFWRISEGFMSPCCQRGLNQLSASLEELAMKIDEPIQPSDRSLRSRLHAFCEGDGTPRARLDPRSSSSHKKKQNPDGSKETLRLLANATDIADDPDVIWEPNPAFGYVEPVCILWFTFEYLLRIIVTPNRLQFFCGIMNIVDLIAILPFYLEMGLSIFGIDIASLSDIKGALLVVRVLRVLRVVRILKLAVIRPECGRLP
ncbi:unnamed protein product, partial [Mesorhabditis spiculigera]